VIGASEAFAYLNRDNDAERQGIPHRSAVIGRNGWEELMDADYCRHRADHYRRCAYQMSDLNDKVTLLELVAYWMQMAEEAERKVAVEKCG
jgi:hypothetical protein